jgi:ABC transporter
VLTTTVQLGQLPGVAVIGSVYLSRAAHAHAPRALASAAAMSGTACWLAGRPDRRRPAGGRGHGPGRPATTKIFIPNGPSVTPSPASVPSRAVSSPPASSPRASSLPASRGGKTTLGKIILRLVTASGGRVMFEGEDVSVFKRTGLRDYYRQVQGVFQDPFSSYNPIYKADRVFESIRGVYFRHMPQQAWHDKISSALHAVALNPGDVLGKYPHQLSGGQQQRLLIVRALLLDVKLLVADEIISMLGRFHPCRHPQPAHQPEAVRPGDPVHHPRPVAR